MYTFEHFDNKTVDDFSSTSLAHFV